MSILYLSVFILYINYMTAMRTKFYKIVNNTVIEVDHVLK